MGEVLDEAERTGMSTLNSRV